MATNLITPKRKESRRRAHRPVRIFIAFSSVAAVATSLVTILVVHPAAGRHYLPWPLIALALVGIQFMPLWLHNEGKQLQLDFFGVPVVVGCVFLAPPELLLCVLIGAVVGAILMHDPLERGIFNVGNFVLGASLARLVLYGAIGSSTPTGLRGVVALCLTTLVFDVFTISSALVAVTLSNGLPGRDYLRNFALRIGVLFPINAVFAIITITLGLVHLWDILLVAGPALVLGLWYRTSTVASDRYTNLEDLYTFTLRLSTLADTEDIITAAVSEVRSMIRCHHVTLRLPIGQDGVRFELDEYDRVIECFGPMTTLERETTESEASLLVPRSRRERMPDGYGFRELMAAPVKLGDAGTGVMVAGDHTVDSETFDSEDLRFFEALAANLGTALTSSQRLDRLRSEVAAREHQALHDSLTGLANRTLFGQWVVEALAHRRPHQQVAVMVMDLDGFKDVNDTLGHHTGDSILKEVGGRVLAAVGSGRLAARLGGDEFAFVIPAVSTDEEVMQVAAEILDSVSRPVAIEGLVLELRASIGVAMAPKHGTDSATLLRRADVAMYAAKAGRQSIVVYNHEIDQNTKRRLILATELRRAMDARDLEVWYQPIAELESGEIIGLEALLRWRHSRHGSISPNEFIPVAEQSGLIEPLTWWVLETSLLELARWRQDGYELGMAVNVSARSLLGPEIVDRLGRLLTEVGTPPGDLTLEITESLMMTDPDRSGRILTQLAGLGVKIAIDDFGTGYSSLSRLKRLPVHTVKIDRSFVLSMHRDEGDEAIVRATIELARNMGHSVIAEGVEESVTWDKLSELGCDQAQGYLLAAAMPSDELRKWLKARQAPQLAPIRRLPKAARRGA